MKGLNLYSGLGGNRKLWPDYVKVTAVERDKKVARVYKKFFPKDRVFIADAHEFLLKNYDRFDFIWSSPPCPTHSVTNRFLNPQGVIRYPDMNLYQEIIFLKHWFKGKWVVENVKPYYEPLIKSQAAGRHVFWANFIISPLKEDRKFNITNSRVTTQHDTERHMGDLQKYHGFDLSSFDVPAKRKMLRNCVNPKLGLHVFNCAFKEKQQLLGGGL